MSDVRSLVQTALDTALDGKVRVYWQRKSGADADEYIVYTQSGDAEKFHADDIPVAKSCSITVKYYYRADLLDTYSGRQAVKSRELDIQEALEEAGFKIPFGSFDAGDVDDIGYFVTVFECEYLRET